ncbi:MAG: carbohydrate kinase [Ekhidna sp.]|nr:carbohydrate kinase [Ekhidna sp.]
MIEVKALCFGEVLYDLLPSGKVPGGSPMNVAIHLQNLGVSTAMVSRVGMDDFGGELVSFLKDRAVQTDYIQKDPSHETGTVRVNVDKVDAPTYTILEKVAWDYIDDSFIGDELDPKYIVHGSLAYRSPVSRKSLQKLIKSTNAKVVFDMNIRSPFYSKLIVDECIKKASILKINMQEFRLLKDWFYIKNPKEEADLKAIKALYPNLETILLTKDRNGAKVWMDGKIESVAGIPIQVKDAVGSGDAFVAAFITGLENGMGLKKSLHYANAAGAFVASTEGANPKMEENDILDLLGRGKSS